MSQYPGARAYAALQTKEEDATAPPPPPAYALAIEMPTNATEERDFKDGVCDCCTDCPTCWHSWCCPWVSLGMSSHKIGYTSCTKVMLLWLSLGLMWLITICAGHNAVRQEFIACKHSNEAAHAAANHHLLSVVGSAGKFDLDFSAFDKEGDDARKKEWLSKHQHGGKRGEHHKPCNKTKDGMHDRRTATHPHGRWCPGASRAMRLTDFITNLIRCVAWIAFTVILAGARHKVRRTYGFDGGDCTDVCCSAFCSCCVLAQMARQLDTLADGCLSVPKPVNSAASTTVVVPAVPIANQQV